MNIPALIGGVLIGIAASLLLLFNGRIMGASGIAAVFVSRIPALFKGPASEDFEVLWRFVFLVGLLVGGFLLFKIVSPAPAASTIETHPLLLALSGLLVGIGTRLGWGCTSGHGICGVGRLSGRSMIATATFIGAGILAATFFR